MPQEPQIDLEVAILNTLSERGRISIAELSRDLDSTSEAVQIPLAHLTESEKVIVSNDDVILRLSTKERKDFERLDRKFDRGHRDSIAALREIREGKLYRESYPTFDDYMRRRGHTRQWATQQINWLRTYELLENNGKNPYHLSVDDAQPLAKLKEHPEELVRAVIEAEAEAETGKEPTKKIFQATVARQLRFLERQKEFTSLPDFSYDESRLLDRLNDARRSGDNLIEEAEATAKDSEEEFTNALLSLCDQKRSIPNEFQLLTVARGDVLKSLVNDLEGLIQKWVDEQSLKKEEKELQQKMASVQRKLGLTEAKKDMAEESERSTVSESISQENADEDDHDDTGTAYSIELSGDFSDWLSPHFYDLGNASFTAHAVADILDRLANNMTVRGPIFKECSIVVRPYIDDEPPFDVIIEYP